MKEKVYGKQKVYVADQSQFPEVDDSEIKTMDSNIAELTQQVQTTMEEVKKLESGKSGFQNGSVTFSKICLTSIRWSSNS